MMKIIKMILNWFKYHDEKTTSQLTQMEEVDRSAGVNFWL